MRKPPLDVVFLKEIFFYTERLVFRSASKYPTEEKIRADCWHLDTENNRCIIFSFHFFFRSSIRPPRSNESTTCGSSVTPCVYSGGTHFAVHPIFLDALSRVRPIGRTQTATRRSADNRAVYRLSVVLRVAHAFRERERERERRDDGREEERDRKTAVGTMDEAIYCYRYRWLSKGSWYARHWHTCHSLHAWATKRATKQ